MLKEYSMYFSAYLLNNLKEKDNIEKIILFGSVAKDETEKESDIDIFIEVIKKSNKFEKEVKKIEEDFYNSREASLFKLKKVNNKFSIKIGKLQEWNELKASIESTGILLYGKLLSFDNSGQKYSIIYWDKIEKNRGAFLNKLYGFNVKNKRYSGLIEELNGKKLGKSLIMIPVIHREKIIELIKKYKVNAKIIEVYY